MFKKKPLLALLTLACSQAALADGPVVHGDAVIVTASRSPDKVSELPANVRIISAEDIRNSTARTVQDVLAGVAGVHLFNNSGSPDATSVDLRGFGMTGSSNTLILIDGVKQNVNDLSSPNLGVVPLSQIERIEVVRGAGAVAYGGGATGGVINIITRSGFGARETVEATVTAGSYNLKKLDLAAHAAGEQVALDAYAKSMTSDNYRANNAERNDSAGLSVTMRHQGGDVRLYARTSNQDLRLPGARKVNPATGLDEYANDPRGTSTPQNYMDVVTDTAGLQAKQAVGDGMLLLDVAQRGKHMKSAYVNSNYYSWRDLDERSSSLRYEQEVGKHRVVVGVDALDSGTDIKNLSGNSVSTTRVEQHHLGGFADLLLRPQDGSSINAGWRSERVQDQANGATRYQSNKELHAWQLGGRQALSSSLDAYAKLGSSFRIANSDEWGFIAAPLKPQTSKDKEIGLAWQQNGSSLQAAWFRYDIDNELYYNPLVPANLNLDPTRHQGVELEARHKLTSSIDLNGSLTWLQATFRSGRAGNVDLSGKQVPMVPQQLANLGLSWQVQEASRLGLEVVYVGKQRFNGDEANQFAKQMPAYTLVNAKVSHRLNKTASVALDVNNLFNRQYASYAGRGTKYTGSTGPYSLYTAPGRNMQASLTLSY